MKIGKLIEELKKILEKHGDVDCGYEDGCSAVTISEVKYHEEWEDVSLN